MKFLSDIRGIRYGLLQDEDVGEMSRLLAEAFSRYDPLAVAVGVSSEEIEGLVTLFGGKAVSEGLTILARAGTGEVVGAMLANDFASPQPPGIELVSSRFAPIGAILDSLDDEYRLTRTIVSGSHLHLFMLGVSAAFAGGGIAQSMIRISLENGAKRGYRFAVTEATGRVSQNIFRKLGFSEIQSALYKQFLHEGRRVFASIAGQEGTLLMERQIGPLNAASKS